MIVIKTQATWLFQWHVLKELESHCII